MVDIVGVGSPIMDLVVNVSRVPRGNGATGANEIFHQGGGNCASALAACARLGASAGMLAKVGGDGTGDFIIRDFIYNGVDTSCIIRGAPDTSSPYCISVSEVEEGTRLFIGRWNKAIARLEVSELDYEYIGHAKILHLDSGSPVSLAAAKFAREKGIKVSIDAGGFTEDRIAIMPYVDVFIASGMFYSEMFKDNEDDLEGNCLRLHDMGPEVIWVTRGAQGCFGLVDGKFYNVPAFKVKVIDTTGAGDVFHGAYAAAMLEGLPHPECARYASAVSAIKCMFPGGRTGIPNRQTLQRFLEDGTVLTEEIEERLNYYRRNFIFM
ncbi:MAG: carbohydrate kinase family protein [Treponema sp.]|nr:carbohydrate kinase family protein [Treponema sp.]